MIWGSNIPSGSLQVVKPNYIHNTTSILTKFKSDGPTGNDSKIRLDDYHLSVILVSSQYHRDPGTPETPPALYEVTCSTEHISCIYIARI
jgi:hypothetical protein